jgi:hypothetical protein
MHTSAVLARWDCLTRPLYHSGFRARPVSSPWHRGRPHVRGRARLTERDPSRGRTVRYLLY